ncbi:hypothetical protein [Microaceticoccus formicicus]|uniref:hypothetical protein n=1 Tax=Microaceticoccus formicicus TaxID=3118105 RepID=UPI003CD046DC|nr:hypothetical protein VZL98_07385 [Peptoniphilaceae bacterium AMB_02]
MKREHYIKIIAPVFITLLLFATQVVYIGVFMHLFSSPWKYVLAMIPLFFIGVSLNNLFERIKEIRSGEEDDISKY